MIEKNYPYIKELVDKKQIHLNKNIYIEMDEKGSITIIECSNSPCKNKEVLNFAWEYLNNPNNRIDRNLFGKLELYTSGRGTIEISPNFSMDIGTEDEDDMVTIGEIVTGYRRYNKIKKLLK